MLILEGKKKVIASLFLILSLNISAALLEGVFFTLVIFAITALDGKMDISKLPAFFSNFQIMHNWNDTNWFSFFIIIAVFSQVMKSTLSYFGFVRAIDLSTAIQANLQKKIYRQVFKLNFNCVSKYKTGDLIEYASSPAASIPALTESINQSLVSFFTSVTLTALLLFINTSMTLIVMGAFLGVFYIQKKVVKKISVTSENLTKLQIDLSKETVQHLQSLRLIHTYNREKESLFSTDKNIMGIRDITKRLCSFTNFLTPFNEVVSIMLVGICMVIGPFFLKTNTVPVLLTFLTITYRLSTRFQIFSISIGNVAKNSGFIKRMNEILTDDDKEFVNETGVDFKGFRNRIQFKSVHFKYSPKLKSSIKNMTFEILKGQTVAFVGSSGAGKSTLLDLLTRLYEPQSGEILIDQENLNKFSIRSWRESLGVVSQDMQILHGSIEENIRFGKLDASMDEIIKASKRAGTFEFILNLPGGFKTVVGERGYRLSGGERQRLALARALVRNPQILILDEATSNLDSHSEYFIQKALEKLQHKITIIVVAHRLSTITKSDQIFLVDNGEIVEAGTHEELITLNGKYSSFWEIQSGKSALSQA